MTNPSEIFDDIRSEVGTVLVGNDIILEHLFVALLTRGHVLIEGLPGVAKTTLVKLFARTTGLSFSRIQMTPDILPADITGTHIYRESKGQFELQRGPIFANIVLIDEINRATPKTQSALLEAMQEEQVTIEGETLSLPSPFTVIATQNPIEYEGVYELPEAQRDRFQLKLHMRLPERSDERTILQRFHESPTLGAEDVNQVVDPETIGEARELVEEVYIDKRITEYILDLVEATRQSPDITYGPSPRGSLALLNAAKASAAIDGRSYVLPTDVKNLALPILSHRIVLSTDTELSDVSANDALMDVIDNVQPPGGNIVWEDDDKQELTASNGGSPDTENT